MSDDFDDIVEKLISLDKPTRDGFLRTLRRAEREALAVEINARMAEMQFSTLPAIDDVARLEDKSIDPSCAIAKELEKQVQHADQRADVLRSAVASGFYELTNRIIAPEYATANYAWFHREAWDWLYKLGPGRDPGLILCLYRGAGKTSSIQMMLAHIALLKRCLLYTSPSPRDATLSRMPSSA